MFNNSFSCHQMAHAIRILTMDAVEKAQSGHPGMPMGMADVVTVLFGEFIKHAPWDPFWPDRDRFVLSAGHGSMLLYSLLYLTGYASMTLDQLKSFRQWGSLTPGHPEHGPGIETTTGPLGQGFANAVGMALAERMMSAEFGSDHVDHRTYAIVGDGCLMEGISQEALSLAGHWQLNKLTVFFDDNSITIDGPSSLACSEDTLQRFQAGGWATCSINAHNPQEIRDAIAFAHRSGKPTLIACRSQIGYGSPLKANTCSAHGAPLGEQEVAGTRRALGWNDVTPFQIPKKMLDQWRAFGQRSRLAYDLWQTTLNNSPRSKEFWDRQSPHVASDKIQQLQELKQKYLQSHPHQATRKSSGQVLQIIGADKAMVLGSADLAESTQVLPQGKSFSPQVPEGRYVHYGVREHGMAAVMNGVALHGGFIPCGGTFLVFSDYCRPAIRLSALMGMRVIYVMTHDSIGLGEDGPTHQPIEQLASLRAIPGLYVFRPCDAIETVECWESALQLDAPSVICLTRQNVPTLRQDAEECWSHRGAYVIKEYFSSDGVQPRQGIDLWSTGSEVSLACEVGSILSQEGHPIRVISVPCWRLFQNQPSSYRESLMKSSAIKVAIEAASPMGWEKFVGSDGLIIGIDRFGESAPYQKIYHHLGFDPSEISRRIRAHIQSASI